MFFSTYVLTKKGPLAKIWLAAHWEKKLTSKDVKSIELSDTVVQIVQPAVPIALRTSGELMLGVVRIYAMKVAQLLKDATDVTITLKPRNIQVVKGGKEGKDGATGVTMDLVVGRVGQEQLCEADFNDIADILAPSKSAKKGPMAEAEVVGTAWFPVEASQADEIAVLANDSDIAKLRQDLLANFGANRDGSSTTTKKSSLSSAEHARGANANAAVDALDIGAPLPDGVDFPMPGMDDFAMPGADGAAMPGLDDPFAMPEPVAPTDVPAAAVARKAKMVTLVDAADTVMPKTALQKNIDDRHDIVNAERRHGAVDEDDMVDRATLRAENPLAACDLSLPVPSAALREVFQRALRSSNPATVEALERGRGAAAAADADKPVGMPQDDALGFDQPPMPDFDFQAEMPAAPDQLEPARASKRGRDSEKLDKLSAHADETLARVKKALGTKTGASTKLATLVKGQTRMEAARMFVDVLALTSHNFVAISQAAPYAEISISGGAKLLSATA